MREDMHSEYKSACWNFELTGRLLETLTEVADHPLENSVRSLPLYTSRRLRHERDILAAYKGVDRLIHHRLRYLLLRLTHVTSRYGTVMGAHGRP